MGGDRIAPEMRQRALETIYRATNTLAQMIDEIVDLTAMQSGTIVINPVPLNLKDMMDTALDDWQPNLANCRLTARFSARSPKVYVRADERRLRRVIDALLRNACDFSPDGGLLTVTLKKEHNQACLSITDPGVGIAPEDMPHIFERFWRGTPRDKNGNLIDVRGMGQGLYVVKQIMEAHGGRVEAESSVGKGSTFRLYLQLVEDDETT